MKVGYARVSTDEQSVESQIDALTAAGCERVFTEHASGAKMDRPVLAELLRFLRPGQDTLVVVRLDRLARSLRHLIDLMEDFGRNGIAFSSLNEAIDTTTAGGRLVFGIFAGIAEFERALIRQRTVAGLQAAKARGRSGGRPKLMTPAKVSAAQKMLSGGSTAREVADAFGVSIATLYRHVQVSQSAQP